MNEQITIHLDNLTEEEREQFTKLLSKASEESSTMIQKRKRGI